MYLKSISCTNYKNHINFKHEFSSHINYIYGNNGVGKTNLLDIIYYLSMTKSYFNHIDGYNISYDKDFFTLTGNFIKKEILDDSNKLFKIHFFYSPKKKIVKINDSPYKKIKDHIGFLPVVFFNPDDSDAIKFGSEYRRKIFDAIICQVNKDYLKNLISYNLLIKNRNSLLKTFAEKNSLDKVLLGHYDDKIVPLAEKIFELRAKFIEQLNVLFVTRYSTISKNNEIASVVYNSQLQANKLNILLSRNINKDISLGYTSCGIHKDDFIFFVNGKNLKIMSQGQIKTFFISLKLAQRDFIKREKNINPILLMDDIFEKLDENRIKNLTNIIEDPNIGQIFITDSSERNLKFLNDSISLSLIDINLIGQPA